MTNKSDQGRAFNADILLSVQMLAEQRVTEDVAARAAETAVSGARALSKNAYKIPMTKGVVRRSLVHTAQIT